MKFKLAVSSAFVKVCGWRPHDGGAAHTGAGVRKPPREETAGGVERPRVRRYGDFGVGGGLVEIGLPPLWDTIARGTKPVDRLRWAEPASLDGTRTTRGLSNE